MNDQFSHVDLPGPGAKPMRSAAAPVDPLGPVMEPEDEGFDIDFQAIWSILYRNRFIIISIIVLALLAGQIITMLTTPTYLANTSVQIEQQATKVLESQDTEPVLGTQDTERFLQTQLDIIRSRSLANAVAESLGLFRDNRFLIAMNTAPSDAVIGRLDAAGSKRERVLRVLESNLSVNLPRNSRIAQIAFESPDPVLAARIANSFAENYITSNLRRRFEASSYARNFLEDQLRGTKQRLEESERAIIAYARGARLIDASSGTATGVSGNAGPRSLTTSNLVQLNDAYSQARAARVQAEQRWNSAQATPIMSLPEVLTNNSIQQLSQRRAELRAAYEEDAQRRKADYPTQLQAAAKIRELDDQIARFANSVKSSIREQYEVARAQEQALEGNVGQLKTETLAEQDRSIRYNILKREVDTNRALYDGLLQRYKEISAAAGITSNNISIIDQATTPTGPISPRPTVNMALAGLGGLVLALLLTFVREKFDDVVRSPEDLNRKLGLPLLTSVPVLPAGTTADEALADPRSSFSEAYYTLRTSLEISSSTGLPRTIVFTSSRPAEGKSTSSYAVARDFARVGRKVVLVDADLRKPSLHRVLNLSNTVGLANVLAQQNSVTEALQQTEIDKLSFIACGPLPPNPAELLGGRSLHEMIDTLTTMFDLVILDSPPIMGLADAVILSAAAEATVFVIEANNSHRGQAKIAIRRLVSARSRIIGAVLTKFDAKKIGYSAYYGYSYSYDYGSTTKPDGK